MEVFLTKLSPSWPTEDESIRPCIFLIDIECPIREIFTLFFSINRQYQQQADAAGQPLFLRTNETSLFHFIKDSPSSPIEFKEVTAVRGRTQFE